MPMIGQLVEVYWDWLKPQVASEPAMLVLGEAVWACGMAELGTGWYVVESIMRRQAEFPGLHPAYQKPLLFIGLRRML